MRPQSIVWFERLFLGTIALGLIRTWLDWDQLLAQASAAEINAVPFLLATDIFVLALITTLTLLISRCRSRIAMWISIALFVLGIPVFLGLLLRGAMVGSAWIIVLQTVAQLVAYGLLFTRDSRAWMNSKGGPAADLKDTFR